MDQTTKIILAAIALGLWANAGTLLFRPSAAIAEDYGLSGISSAVSSIRSDLGHIESGHAETPNYADGQAKTGR